MENDGYLPNGAETTFVANHSVGETDINGLWLSSNPLWKSILKGGKIITSHQNSIYRKISGLSANNYKTIISADVFVDDDQNITPQSTAKHAMSSRGEGSSAARALANSWVRVHM